MCLVRHWVCAPPLPMHLIAIILFTHSKLSLVLGEFNKSAPNYGFSRQFWWGDNDNDPCLAQTFVFAVLELSVGLQMDVWMMDWKVSLALSKIRRFKKVTTGIKFWRVLNYLISKKIDKNEFVKKYYRKVFWLKCL